MAILAVAITASYTLGPDTFTVSTNQLAAANYVWSQEKDNNTHCVLGGTYPLLALEAVSEKEIIGGGFPIDANFGQPEREILYNQMGAAISGNLQSSELIFPKTDYCWWYFDGRINFDNSDKQKISVDKIFGDVRVVRYDNLSP